MAPLHQYLRLSTYLMLGILCLALAGCTSFPNDAHDVQQIFTHPKDHLL